MCGHVEKQHSTWLRPKLWGQPTFEPWPYDLGQVTCPLWAYSSTSKNGRRKKLLHKTVLKVETQASVFFKTSRWFSCATKLCSRRYPLPVASGHSSEDAEAEEAQIWRNTGQAERLGAKSHTSFVSTGTACRKGVPSALDVYLVTSCGVLFLGCGPRARGSGRTQRSTQCSSMKEKEEIFWFSKYHFWIIITWFWIFYS